MLDKTLSTQLGQYLTNLREPIELVASTSDGDNAARSAEMVELLTEIASLHDLVTLRTDGEAERRPSFEIVRASTANDQHPVSVRFAGVPLGHEFTSLALALLHVGGHPPKIDDEVRAQIEALPGGQRFETFYSLSCQNCPDVVQGLNIISVLNPKIRHTAIDGALFPQEAEDRNVLAVPTVFDTSSSATEVFANGRQSIEQLVALLDDGAEQRVAAQLNERAPYDVLIVGAGPAGSAAAVYAARKGLRTGIVADRFGGQVLDTMGIENFISVPYTEGPKLGAALEQHVREYGVDVMTPQRAIQLIPAAEPGGHHVVEVESGATLRSRTVVLAAGARWRHLNVPGEADYLNAGVAFCPHCDGPLFKGKRIAVIGGGNSGVEAAIDLAGIADHVTTIEFMDSLIADDVLQAKLRSLPNVNVVLGAATTEVLGDGTKVTGLRYTDRTTGDTHEVDVAGIFVQIGLVPSTDWLRGTVDLTERGEIIIDDRGQTSLPGVFAGGDATTAPYKQIVVALGAGATAGLSAFDYLIRTPEPATVVTAAASS